MRLIISNANQFHIKKDLLWVVVMTFVTILVWISYSIYLAYNTSTIDPQVTSLMEPLSPILDQKALDYLSEKNDPPTEFTILVKREVGDTTVVVPLSQADDFDLKSSTLNQDDLLSTSNSIATTSALENNLGSAPASPN
jgi:hypothetical protein